MNEKKYLIYLDILGFEKLAEDIAKEKGIERRLVRERFIDVIKERVDTIEAEKRIIGKHYGESDEWLLVTDDLDKVFRVISEILDHNTGYRGYEKIPLEIGVGTAEYDKWAKFSGKNLIIEDETIELLKTYIVNYYRAWYKEHHDGQRITSTFIVFTELVYRDLKPLDKKMCRKINYNKDKNQIIFFAVDVGRALQRGKTFEFLEKVGYPDSKVYGRIDEAYVPPANYEDIKKTLSEKRIIFITGTQEYGKTYTAVRLMWEYYNEGYTPKWVKGGEEKERINVRKRLENIEAELKSNHAIYFEDPFGRRMYEENEELERKIGTIIESCRRSKDTCVIITSREEVFKEFEKRKPSQSDIREYEKSLTLKRPSYDYEKRKEILLKWAENEDCQWIDNADLRRFVLKAVKNEKVLPTPLSMRDFSKVTMYIDKENQLKDKIEEKSEETAKAFSREIKNMSDDKILFLSFLFISRRFKINFVKTMYEKLVKELNLTNAWEFDRVLNWFKDDKVNVCEHAGFEYVLFSHSLYSEALKHLLVEDGYITRINKEIFSKLSLKLAEKDEAAGEVARAVADNFNRLPENVRNLLFNLSEKDEAAGEVARAVADNFNRLPENVRNKLLFNLSEKDEAAGEVARAVADNFNRLPENVRSALLLTLSEKDEAARRVARVVADNFNRLPENVRNKLLLNLSEKDEAAGEVARAVVDNFNIVPKEMRNLLFDFPQKNEAAREVARAVVDNFNSLPEEVRSELLLTLSEKDEAAREVARAVVDNFNSLPENVRNKLLLNLSEKDEAAGEVARAVADNFNSLPENVKKLLSTLSKKDESADIVAPALARNFNRLPEDMKELFLTLSEKDEAAWGIARAVAGNSKRIPEDVRNKLLLNLSEKDEAAREVAWTVSREFSRLPEDVRNRLLLNLSEKDKAADIVAAVLRENFDKIPDDVRNTLLLNLFGQELQIRRFNKSDIEYLVKILTLNNQYNYPVIDGPNAMERVAACKAAVFLVAEIKEQPCGFIRAVYDGSRALIHLLSVHPDYQHRGIGTALVNAVCKEFSHQGAPSVSATVTEQSVGFWEKQGFKRTP
ncbi:MAG: GNAT family N-acetyltransferase, partial [Theionarchaea archaeon]|nr:GNAT family N-acetyltransferase [Theionarchaea archaeon]